MDSKEVELRGKAITKAFSGGEPSSTILNQLEELRKGVVASEELLRSTRIGVTVNKLKQHKDPAIARQASELVSKWRGDVRKSGTGSSTPKSSNGTTATATASPAPSPVPPKPKVKAKLSVPPEQRDCKTDGIDYKLTGNVTRDNCLKLMYNGLAHMSEESPDDVLRMAREVELAAFNAYQPETSEPYKSKMRSLFQNLKSKSNPDLRKRVLSGDITPYQFVRMSHEELKSAKQRAEDAKINQENMNNAMVAQAEKSISASLQCGKCGQKKVSYSQAQTRSADEPMTTFCECMNCGHRWKFS
ncbi:transcription elongation factor S-II [Patellaria atrata CBS 101060]|uniref:Transcription elongation factor n=1 Tax=Patellaria atrata CBS 101060 TaxID=1346257 RepID=A0A9P4S4A8_9PEZI|nr:transcription elongation factor S-II [Patellaria atrata CBS 101060]